MDFNFVEKQFDPINLERELTEYLNAKQNQEDRSKIFDTYVSVATIIDDDDTGIYFDVSDLDPDQSDLTLVGFAIFVNDIELLKILLTNGMSAEQYIGSEMEYLPLDFALQRNILNKMDDEIVKLILCFTHWDAVAGLFQSYEPEFDDIFNASTILINDKYRTLKNENLNELFVDYFTNNKETVYRLKTRFDLIQSHVFFSLVVLVSDNYLKIKSDKSFVNDNRVRFFRILNKIPLESQNIICDFLIFRNYKSIILSTEHLSNTLKMFY